MNTEVSEKDQMRAIYHFKNDATFDAFYDGMVASFSGDNPKSVEMFARVVELEPDNPIGYNFLVMSLEFDETSTEADRLKWVETWAEVAAKSGIGTQILRANMALQWYKATPEERAGWGKHGTKDAPS